MKATTIKTTAIKTNRTKQSRRCARNHQEPTYAAFASAVKDYFEQCDSTREKIVLKNGGITYHQIPYTLAGLASHLNIDTATLVRYCNGSYPGRNRKRIQTLLRTAATRVERYVVERALLGELNNAVAAMLLKSWGYGETSEAETVHGDTLEVKMDDPEQWSD